MYMSHRPPTLAARDSRDKTGGLRSRLTMYKSWPHTDWLSTGNFFTCDRVVSSSVLLGQLQKFWLWSNQKGRWTWYHISIKHTPPGFPFTVNSSIHPSIAVPTHVLGTEVEESTQHLHSTASNPLKSDLFFTAILSTIIHKLFPSRRTLIFNHVSEVRSF